MNFSQRMLHKRVARRFFFQEKKKQKLAEQEAPKVFFDKKKTKKGPKSHFFKKKKPKRPKKVPESHFSERKKTKWTFFQQKKRLQGRKKGVPSKSGLGLGRDMGWDWVGVGSGLVGRCGSGLGKTAPVTPKNVILFFCQGVIHVPLIE